MPAATLCVPLRTCSLSTARRRACRVLRGRAWARSPHERSSRVDPNGPAVPSTMTLPRPRGLDALALQRIGHWCQKKQIPLVPQAMKALGLCLFGALLSPETSFGHNVLLGSRGLGTVIHKRARVGNNVVIGNGVTIGGRSRLADVPVIEDDCYIGVGARVLGPIRVGRGSVIGANAVVLEDVAPRSVVAGVPARVIRQDVEVRELV